MLGAILDLVSEQRKGGLQRPMSEVRWKELCVAIMQETDPARLVTLVEQLNQALEQRETDLRHSRSRQKAQLD